jgi:hypothetical protein
VKRWIVVAALAVTAAGGIVTPGAARASSTAWYEAYQSGFTGWVNDIAAISKNNAWAVGETYTKAGKPVDEPFIRHFNGTSWQVVTIPGSAGSTSSWVSASAANNVWVGGNKSSSTGTFSAVYRWNGARWGKVPMPAMAEFGGFAVLAPNNVWAFGMSSAAFDEAFHWNGSKWQGYLSASINFVPSGISASAANNVWVTGYAFSGHKQVVAAYRWNGSAWHAVSMPHPALYAGPAVTALSASNVWIGYDAITKPEVATSYALHWDGQHWHALTAPDYADISLIVPDGKGGYWFGPQAILTASTWTSEQVPGYAGNFSGVTRIPGTTSFLVGAGVDTSSSSAQKPTIFRFDL